MMIETEENVAAYFAQASGKTYVKGGGTRRVIPSDVDHVLDVSGLHGVELYDPAALTLIVKAGTAMETIEALLAQEGQTLAFEPMDHRHALGTKGTPTIGGAIAGNISGPRRVSAGAARDFVLGLRFVTSEGHIVKNGGRVMKNVTGIDLSRFLTGSWGQLAVITQIALKVLPVAHSTSTLAFHGLDFTQARDLMSQALGLPYEVTGASFVSQGDATSSTYLRLEGMPASIERRASALCAELQSSVQAEILSDSAPLWRDIRDLKCLTGGGTNLWRIDTRPSIMPLLAAQCSGPLVIDWGGGRIWTHHINQESLTPLITSTNSFITNIAHSGSKIFATADQSSMALQLQLQQQFDPQARFLSLA